MNQFKLYSINFKKIALANKVSIHDSSGTLISYSHQKLLKLKEQILFFTDEQKTRQIAEVNANKVIDFNVKLTLTDEQGNATYSLVRHGRKSIWKANYDIIDAAGNIIVHINEKNPMVKVLNTLVGEIPLMGLVTGYILNVKYAVSDPQGNEIVELKKEPAFLESNYSVLSAQQGTLELPILQLIAVMLMRERYRS